MNQPKTMHVVICWSTGLYRNNKYWAPMVKPGSHNSYTH